jgi:hypothetical protein
VNIRLSHPILSPFLHIPQSQHNNVTHHHTPSHHPLRLHFHPLPQRHDHFLPRLTLPKTSHFLPLHHSRPVRRPHRHNMHLLDRKPNSRTRLRAHLCRRYRRATRLPVRAQIRLRGRGGHQKVRDEHEPERSEYKQRRGGGYGRKGIEDE